MARFFLKFFIPGSLIFSGTLTFLQLEIFSSLWPTIAGIYPYGIFIVGLLLGWRFSRSRLVFMILVLAFADRALLRLHLNQSETLDLSTLIYDILSFFVPINLMVIALIKERGILTLRGMIRISFLGAQPVAIYLLFKHHYVYVFDFLNYHFIDLKLLENFSLGQPALLAFVMAAVVIMVNFVIRQDIIEGGFFWTLICILLAFINFKIPEQATIYFSSGGLILITSVLEYSHSVAFRDELTGLATRRSLNDAFLKLPGQYAIAMVDVDHFKKINDQHGHDLGDQVLRMIASKLSKVGGGGKAYRYGGEEFTIVFPGKNVNEARPHAELLRKMIATTPFYIRSKRRPRKKPDNLASVPRSRKTIPISVSIGVAGRDETHDSPQDVLKAADEALLRAKKAGRNRVRIFGRIHPRG